MEEFIHTAENIGLYLAQIIIAIAFAARYVKKALDNREPIGTGIRRQNEIDMDIIERLDYYKELLDCDRILLFEFHNGQHYSSHRSALKMSAPYETYRAGLNSAQAVCSNLPISIMPRFIAEITNKGEAICKNIEEIKNEMGNTYEFKRALGIKSYYDMAIRDKEGEVCGFVAVQWNKTMPEDVNVEEIKKLTWYLEEKVKLLTRTDDEVKKENRRLLKRNSKH